MSDAQTAGPGISEAKPLVVVGGGLIGLCIAYYLADAGVPAIVIERHDLGSGASWGNAGWICESHSAPIPAPGVVSYALRSLGHPASPLYLRPLPDPRFAWWLLGFWRSTRPDAFARGYRHLADLNRQTFALYDGLRDSGIDTSLRRVGMVHAFLSVSEAREFLAVQRMMADGRYTVPDEVVTGEDVATLDPSLHRDVRAGYLVEGEGVVEPGRLVTGLAKAISERSGQLLEHTEVTGFARAGSTVTAVRTPAGDVDCGAVVIAAGTRSDRLLRMLGDRLPLQAGKGYSFSADLDPAPQHALYLSDRRIAVSPMNGTTRITGTMEFSGNNRRMDWRRITAIALGSREYLGPWFRDPDDLTTQIRDPWVGARPLLPDGLPVIDRTSATSNAYVATGHGMLGVTLAPATGAALAQFVVTRDRPDVLAPFRIDRWRSRRAG